jgi:hypothetical protein
MPGIPFFTNRQLALRAKAFIQMDNYLVIGN